LDTKVRARVRRHKRVRKKIQGTAERPRLAVFRSNKHIYAQLIDDLAGNTLVAASSTEKGAGGADGDKKAIAGRVGTLLGERAVEKGIKRIVFDRGGRLYQGRVQSLAESAREAGLEF
jgi:large subunit ribosomal protein L18